MAAIAIESFVGADRIEVDRSSILVVWPDRLPQIHLTEPDVMAACIFAQGIAGVPLYDDTNPKTCH